MKYLILAHPRCGTGYTAACFRQVGVDVGHERVGADGIASWMWAVLSPTVPWGDARVRFPGSFCATLIHVIRNPYTAIPSIVFTEHPSEPFRRQFIYLPNDPDPIVRAIWSLVGWSGIIRAQNPNHTCRLESIEERVSELTGQEVKPSLEPRERNARPHPRLEESEIRNHAASDPRTAEALDWLEAQWKEAA